MWLTAFFGALFFQFAIFQMTIFNSLSTHIIADLGLSNTEFGFIGSLYFYCAAIFLIPAGLWLDRGNIKKIIFLIFTLNLMALLSFYFFPSVFTLIIYRVFCGISNCFGFLACMKILSKCFSGKQLGIANSMIIAFSMLGGVLESPFEQIVNSIGWHNALLTVFAYGGISCLLMMLMLNTKVIKNKAVLAQQPSHKIGPVIKEILSSPLNWQCGFYTGLMNLPVTLLAATWGSLYLINIKSLTSMQANSVIGMIFIGMIIASPLIGWVSTHLLSRKNTMIVGAIASLIIIIAIILIPASSFLVLMISFTLLGGVATTQILSYPIVTEANSLSVTGTAMSFISILVYLIGAALS
ncbi:MAG: MFS transporter, partial [Gammaproteobacteria bacterium]|nr:MFS transporter [Gammaproteobacteria bacterium]